MSLLASLLRNSLRRCMGVLTVGDSWNGGWLSWRGGLRFIDGLCGGCMATRSMMFCPDFRWRAGIVIAWHARASFENATSR